MGGIRRTSICEEGNKESPQRIDSIEVLLEKKRPLEEEEIRHIEKENHVSKGRTRSSERSSDPRRLMRTGFSSNTSIRVRKQSRRSSRGSNARSILTPGTGLVPPSSDRSCHWLKNRSLFASTGRMAGGHIGHPDGTMSCLMSITESSVSICWVREL